MRNLAGDRSEKRGKGLFPVPRDGGTGNKPIAMMKKLKRILSGFLCAVLLFSETAPVAFAASDEAGISDGEVSAASADSETKKILYSPDETIPDGTFYLDTGYLSAVEGGEGETFRILRSGGDACAVTLTMTDLTAGYGKDYVLSCDGVVLENRTQGSVSLLDYMTENADEIEEYSVVDALLDGTALPEDGSEEALSEEQLDSFEEAASEFLQDLGSVKTAVPVPDGSAGALAAAHAAATGHANDKAPMDGSAFAIPQLDDLAEIAEMNAEIDALNEALASPVVSLEFAAGETEKTVVFLPIDNGEYYAERRVFITLSSEEAEVASEYASCTAEIVDDEPAAPAVIGFSAKRYSASNGYIAVTVSRSGDLSSLCSVQITTEDGSAVSGRDYSCVNAQLDFPFGIQRRTVKIPVRAGQAPENASFTLRLSAPVGCELENAEARCLIDGQTMRNAELPLKSNSALKSAPALTSSGNDVPVLSALNLSELSPQGDGGAFNGVGWSMSACDDWFSPESAGVLFTLPATYIYNGFQIVWARYLESLFNNCGKTEFFAEGENAAGEAASNTFYSGSTENWSTCTDTYYSNLARIDRLGFNLSKDAFGPDTELEVSSIKPVLREFKVSLADYEPVKLRTKSGELRPCTECIDEYKNLSTVTLDGADQTTGVLTVLPDKESGITLCLPDTASPIAYIKGVELVSTDGTKSVVIANNLPMGQQTCYIKFDPQFVNDYSRSNGIIGYKEASGRGLYGEFKLRPILGNIDAEVSVEASQYVSITADKELLNRYGTAYNFHRGDYASFDVSMKSEYANSYSCKSICYTQGGVNSSDSVTAEVRNGKAGFYVTRRDVSVKANVTANNTEFLVRVLTDDLPKFSADSPLFRYESRKDGAYTYFIVADKDHFSVGEMYELSVRPNETLQTDGTTFKNYNAVPIWTEPATGISYAQNCVWLEGRANLPEFNVITLSILASHSYDAPLTGTVLYADAASDAGAVGTSWMPASDVLIRLDELHYGISDTDGTFKTQPLPIARNGKKKYTIRFRVEAAGNIYYRDVTVDSTLFAAIKDSGELRTDAVSVSPTPKNAPFVNSVTLARNGTIQSDILLDPTNPTTVTVNIANSGLQYTAPSGEIMLEKPAAVELIIYDNISHQPIGNPIPCTMDSSKPNNSVWQANVGVSLASGVTPESLLFVRITTDRQRTLGSEEAVLNSAVYAPVPVRSRFVAPEYEVPAQQTLSMVLDDGSLELPVIGKLGSAFDSGSFTFIIDTDTNPGVTRFYIGTKESFSGKTPGIKAGNPLEVMESAKELTKSLSLLESYTGGSAVCGMSEWKVKINVGLYFDFCMVTEHVEGVANQTVNVWKFNGAGGYFGTRSTASYCYYTLILGWPCYIGGDVDFTVGAHLGGSDASLSELTPDKLRKVNNAISGVNFDAIVMAELNTKLYAGVGLAKIAGVRGQIALTIAFAANTPATREFEEITHPTGWHVTGNMKLILDLILQSIDIDVGSWDFLESGYFKDVRKMSEQSALSASAASANDSMVFLRKPRSDAEGEWMGDKRLLMSPGPGAEISEKTLLTGGYDRPEPQMITYTDDGGAEHTLLVFLDDDETRTDDERTALYWSIRTGSEWSKPVMLQNDKTADFSPNLCDAGDKILVSWTSRKVPAGETTSALLRSMEVYTCFFDKRTGTFGHIEQLTNDDYFDSAPIAACDVTAIPYFDTHAETEPSKTRPASGQVFLYYLKSAVPENIDTAEDLISAALPLYNCAEPVYRIYNGTEWVTPYYEAEAAQVTNAAELAAEWNGQRFLNTAIPKFSVNNPVISDAAVGSVQYHALSNTQYNALFSEEAAGKWNVFSQDYNTVLSEVVNSSKNAALLAYTVDADRDLNTGYDRELFIQLYDYLNHKTSAPIRITNNAVSECDPQIVCASNATWLFWLEEGGTIRYLNVSAALEQNIDDQLKLRSNDAKWNSERVSAAKCVDTGKAPCPVSYTAFGTPYGGLYVAWQQSADTADGNGQQAVYVTARSYSSGNDSYSWSNGVRLESNSNWNELPAMASLSTGADGNKSWLMINSRCDLNSDNGMMTAENTRLVAATVNPRARCDIDSVTVETTAADAIANNTIDVSLHIVNNGLAASNAFSVESKLLCGSMVLDTETAQWQKSDDSVGIGEITAAFPLFPGNGKTLSQSFEIPAGTHLPDCVLEVTVTDGTSHIVSTDSFPLYESGSFYEISSVGTEQIGDGFVLRAMLRNAGAEETDPTDVITASFNDAYHTGAAEEEFGRITIGALTQQIGGMPRGLAVGESIALELPLTVSDEKMNTGYVNGCLDIQGADKQSLAQGASFMLCLSAPYGLRVNGGQNRIILHEGDTLPLSGTYRGNGRFIGGTVTFRAEDNTVAMTDGNTLMALSPGTTMLDMTVEPFGGSGTVTVEVLEADSDIGNSGGSSASTSTMPVSGSNVRISATVIGSTATVKEIPASEISKIGSAEVSLDFSAMGKSVDRVSLPAATMETISQSASSALAIKLTTGTVAFDAAAVDAISEAATGKDIVLNIEAVDAKTLSAAQKSTVDDLGDAVIIKVTLASGGGVISDFDGGSATVTVPYKRKNASNAVIVYYMDDAGKLTKMNCTYDAAAKSITFTTAHFSEYVIAEVEVAALPFIDVAEDSYYADAVRWAYLNKVTEGTSATAFSPNAPVTRAQVVTFLWRAAGCPVVNCAMNMSDVKADAYYTEAVRWALSEGITKGTGISTFSPNMVCTRGQIVTFLARFAGVEDADTASGFSDVKSTDYFAAAVKWAKDNKVTEGTSATTFSPNADCTRAQVVTFLYRWMVK